MGGGQVVPRRAPIAPTRRQTIAALVAAAAAAEAEAEATVVESCMSGLGWAGRECRHVDRVEFAGITKDGQGTKRTY